MNNVVLASMSNVELTSTNNVELASMNNVELASMNNVELASMNNVELASMNNVELASMNNVELASMNNVESPSMNNVVLGQYEQRCMASINNNNVVDNDHIQPFSHVVVTTLFSHHCCNTELVNKLKQARHAVNNMRGINTVVLSIQLFSVSNSHEQPCCMLHHC